MRRDLYKSRRTGFKYWLVKSFRGPYASFRRAGVSEFLIPLPIRDMIPISLLRRDMVFIKSFNTTWKH